MNYGVHVRAHLFMFHVLGTLFTTFFKVTWNRFSILPYCFFLFFEFKIPVNVFNSANFVSYLHHNCYYQKHYGMVLFKSCGFL